MKKLLLIILASTVTGCAQYSVLASDTDKTAVAFTQRMAVGMSNKLDKLITPMLGSKNHFNGYETYKVHFFPIEGGISGVNESWSSYCEKIGGHFLNQACEDKEGNLLFLAKAGQTKGYGISISVIEPTGEADWNFRIAAEQAGYKTRGQRQQHKDALAIQQFNRSLKIEKRRSMNAKAILESGIGSQVCKDQNGDGVNANLTFIGFVERIENERIKVSVQFAQYTSAPNMSPGGFQPQDIWSQPGDWYLC